VRRHSGNTGGYASFVAFDPARRTGVVILTNAQVGVLDRLGTALLLMLASEPYALDLPRTASVDPAIYARAVDAIVEFKVDASGQATQLVILQGGNVITATRSQ
jgi:CubicO group peptidase (beta-lactamase class C family)